jgi:NAD(P) transhydrogenase subunit alpha
MKIAVLRETADAENRVAGTPETIKKLIALGATLAVESGAGAGANISDAAYAEAGASVGDRAAVIGGADLILGVQGPVAADLPGAKPGAMLAAILSPFADKARIDGYAKAGITALSMEFMPRITRAQSMDVLSSQSTLRATRRCSMQPPNMAAHCR